MHAIDSIRFALQMTRDGTLAIVDGLAPHAMATATPGGKAGDGNHPLWLLGHLCVVEGGVRQIATGEPSTLAHWQPLFGTATRSRPDASAYPSFDELVDAFKRERGRTLAALDVLTPDQLDAKPNDVPPEFADVMTSVGRTLMVLPLHNMVHYGQLADVRRVAGLQPLI